MSRKYPPSWRAIVELHIEDNVRSGMSPAQAQSARVLKLSRIEQTKEQYRRTPWPSASRNMVARFSLCIARAAKKPGFALVVVFTLAFGIGANTASMERFSNRSCGARFPSLIQSAWSTLWYLSAKSLTRGTLLRTPCALHGLDRAMLSRVLALTTFHRRAI